MLSLGYALKKSCSGPVGGNSSSFKISQQYLRQRQSDRLQGLPQKNPRRGYLPAKQLGGRQGLGCVEYEGDFPPSEMVGDMYPQQMGNPIEQDLHSHVQPPSTVNCGRSEVLRVEDDVRSHNSRSRSQTASWTRRRAACLDNALNKLADERLTLEQGEERGQSRRSRNLSSAGGSVISRRSYGSSSCPSQAVRSTVLDLELQLERERREAAEKELADLKAQLKAKK